MSNVVSHARFKLDPAGVEHLRSLGVEIRGEFPSDATLGLEEPQYEDGEQVVGVLTDEEFAVFVEIWRCQSGLTDIGKAITAKKLREAADMVHEVDTPQTFLDNFRAGIETAPYSGEEEALMVYSLQAKMQFLKGLFYWQMGEKYQCHHFKTGVRTGRRFVLKDRRY